MAELIERLLAVDAAGQPYYPEPNERAKIPLHAFQAVCGEWSRGKLTAAQALDQLENIGPPRLTAAEQAEAQAIVDLVLSIPVTGTATAQADGRARRALKALEIDQVFLLMDSRSPLYDDPAEVRAKLGI